MIWAIVAMALRQIRRNAVRSFLTMLGIMIGVGAVIALVTLGEGATSKVKSDISKLGDNLLIVSPGADRRGPEVSVATPFTAADLEAIREEVAGVRLAAPTVQKGALVVAGNLNWRTSITGTTNEYLEVRGYEVERGRSFTEQEVTAGQPLCVIGTTVEKQLFPGGEALGQYVRVDRIGCEIIGVLASKGQSSMGQDQDDLVLVPLRMAQRRLIGNTDIGTIYVTVDAAEDTAQTKTDIEDLLRQRRRVQPDAEDDFRVRDLQEIASAMSSATGALTSLLGAIAAVSLLVGGIGIMNIMLVNVTERTREIGTRLAIGALAREVLLQFLVEAIVLSTTGGVIGVALGLGGSYAGTRALGMPFVIQPGIVLVAFGFSAMIGVVFGYLPARKAANLNPIEALRHE